MELSNISINSQFEEKKSNYSDPFLKSLLPSGEGEDKGYKMDGGLNNYNNKRVPKANEYDRSKQRALTVSAWKKH